MLIANTALHYVAWPDRAKACVFLAFNVILDTSFAVAIMIITHECGVLLLSVMPLRVCVCSALTFESLDLES